MRDSFEHTSVRSSALHTMNTDELTVWIQHGPCAILAAAVRGEPPIALRQKLQEKLDRIHVDFAHLVTNFQGNTMRSGAPCCLGNWKE